MSTAFATQEGANEDSYAQRRAACVDWFRRVVEGGSSNSYSELCAAWGTDAEEALHVFGLHCALTLPLSACGNDELRVWLSSDHAARVRVHGERARRGDGTFERYYAACLQFLNARAQFFPELALMASMAS